MSEPHDFSSVIGTLQHEHINMRKQLTKVQLENQVLRRQLYQMSTLLDIAVSRLGAMGVSLETPIDVRALRAEALKLASADVTQVSQGAADSLKVSDEKRSPSLRNSKKKFQLRTELRHHTKSVRCCAFMPNEDPFIVTGGLDCRLVMQNFLNGNKNWELAAHEENISDVACFQGSRQILSASYDGTVKVWDAERSSNDGAVATPLYRHSASGFVLSAIPLDKSFVFVCADSRRRTYIVDTRTQKPISWEHSSRVNSLAFDSSTSHLVMGHSNGLLSVWDIRKAGAVSLSSCLSSAPALEESPPMAAPISTSNANSFHQGAQQGIGTPTTLAAGGSTTPLLRPPDNSDASVPQQQQQQQQQQFPVQCISRALNDPSHANVSFIAHYHSNDDSKRLVVVSDDNMVRLYRCNLDASSSTSRASDLYQLRNVLPGVPTRGTTVRSGFWKGTRAKSQVSVFLDDDAEKDAEQPVHRRVAECDLLVTGGPDNTAIVFDVTEEDSAVVLDHLEGHRDRVTGATTHHSDNRPIIATTSADSTVRIWVPAKH